MNTFETSPAALAVRISSCEKAIEALTNSTQKLVQTQHELAQTTALIQQSLEQHEHIYDTVVSDVAVLKTDRAFMLGSGKVLAVLGSIIIIACAISGALAAWVSKNETTHNRTDNGSYRQESQQP